MAKRQKRRVWLWILVAILSVTIWFALQNRRDVAQEQAAWQVLERLALPTAQRYSARMTADLPPVAQRYFSHAIAPGTPLLTKATLAMEGTFILLGKPLPMTADEIIVPGCGFVWRAQVGGAGWLRLAGSDGLRTGESWTRFSGWDLLPVVTKGDTPDHLRAATGRLALERIFSPASLLPEAGAVWSQTGPDRARVSFPALTGTEPVDLTLDAEGRITEIVTQRWSNANADGQWRLQPFGGRLEGEASAQGFTVPGRMEVGNLFGTPDYVPFFRADITALSYAN